MYGSSGIVFFILSMLRRQKIINKPGDRLQISENFSCGTKNSKQQTNIQYKTCDAIFLTTE